MPGEAQPLLEKVRNGLNKFKENCSKYNLYIPARKPGSEHYILSQLKFELNPVQVIYGSQPVNNDYPILILDDAIYSSFNICNHIDLLRYEQRVKNKFVAIVAVLSCRYVSLTTNYFNCEIIADLELDHLLPEMLFADYDYEYFYKHFRCETSYVLPVFFEHKIANTFGTYKFYHEILDKPICREMIDNITENDIITIIKHFQDNNNSHFVINDNISS